MIDAEHDIKATWVLGMFHWLRYLSLPDGADLEDYTTAVRLLAPVYEADPDVVPSSLHQRYEQIRSLGGAPPPDPVELNSRARNLINSYLRDGELPLLAEAVRLFRAALAASDSDDSGLARRQSNLGAALRMLFIRTGEQELLPEAISLLRHAVAAAPEDERSACQSNLAAALLVQHEVTGQTDLLTEAVVLLEAAVDGLPETDPEQGTILSNLAAARTKLAQIAVTSDALADAVEFHRRILASCPARDPERGRYLSNLGGALQALAERTGNRTLLAEAVEAHRTAVKACPERDPDRPGYLSNLAATLTRLSEATADTAQLREAVDLFRAALVAAPSGDLGRPAYLSNFAAAALRLAERTGGTRLMTEAVEASRIAVDLIPDGHPERASYLSNLGLTLQTVYQRTGDTDLLSEAVDIQRAAVATARGRHSSEVDSLSHLGVALQVISEANGDTGQLAEAVEAGRIAVAAMPPGHPGLAGYLSSLGAALQLLSERSEQAELLAEAVQTLRAATSVSTPEDPGRAGHLSNLGLGLLALFDHTGQIALLQEAVQIQREAVAASLPEDPDRASHLSNLGVALQALSEYASKAELLAEALASFRDAVAATGSGHPDRATYLINMGNALQVSHDQGSGISPPADTGLLTEAADSYAEAAEDTAAPALARIYAYRQMSRLAIRRNAGEDALASAEAAVKLLPQVATRALVRRDRERQLGQLAGLAGDVAAAAISAGRPERAVELLEQTRGLLVAETLQARSGELAKLRATESGAKLAEAFEELRQRLDALDWAVPGRPQQPSPAGPSANLYQARARQAAESMARTRQQAHQAWEELIHQIRASGFPDFLRPPDADELTAQADKGPVVFVFTSPTHCDALVITAGPPPRVRILPLPRLTETEAYRQANQFRDARIRATADPHPERRLAAESQILDILAWLWDTITEPILDTLGYTATPAAEEDWPRLWWCPVGILAYLPLHAAGHHADIRADDPAQSGIPRTVLDRALSSYTPTIRGLAYARGHHPPPTVDTTLIVAVPEAPGTPPLPGVLSEAETLSELIPHSHRLPEPTRGNVLRALPEHAVAHFACHGYADLIDPGASELVVPDREIRPLTLKDISALQLNARLAYLSACDTFIVRQNLADEAVHLTGAFHLAGYQHVIGTLWSINDDAAKELAVNVYTHLTRNGIIRPDADLAARSLHHATRSLRARSPDIPSLWVTHTHTGP